MKILFVMLAFSFTILPQFWQVTAAKPRIKKATVTRATGTTTGYSSAKLSRPTNSVIMTLRNLTSVSKITYTLSYTANGLEQGAVGSIIPNGQTTDSRDVYFGTCSHGVCTAHRNIKNAILRVETKLTNGGTNVKRYRINI